MATLTQLLPRLVAIGVLAVAFVAMTVAISAGLFTGLDREVAQAMHSIWVPSLHPAFQAIAELGGIELTTILMAGLAFYLWRAGFGTDALVFLIFVAGIVLEVLYKHNLHHPGPPASLMQLDGPSLSELLPGSTGGNSFPSGHMLRAVIAYGLIAFAVRRLATSALARAVAFPLVVLLLVVLAFDRLYLDVHWESDVVGGLLLGAIALLAGTVWLDRPKKVEN